MRRMLSLLLSVVLTTLLAPVMLAGTADACACGAVMVRSGDSSQVSHENVLLHRSGDHEAITMSLSLTSDAPDAGLVVPTPSPATVTLGDPATFTALEGVIAPVNRTRHHLVGGRSFWNSDNDGASSGGAPQSADSGSVTALSTVNLGPLEATTLRADDPAALRRWLTTHGYSIRPQVQRLFDLYVAKGWTFVAMKLTPEGKQLSGELPPVTMAFTSKELVHPLQLSRAASNAQHVRTYVLADHKTRRSDATARGTNLELLYAGRPAAGDLPTALRATLTTAPYLTASEQTFSQPKTEIVSDLTFVRATDDAPYTRVIWHDSYLFTWDELVAMALLAALLGSGVVLLIVRLRRRSQ